MCMCMSYTGKLLAMLCYSPSNINMILDTIINRCNAAARPNNCSRKHHYLSSWVIALDDHISHVTVPTAGCLSQTLITLH